MGRRCWTLNASGRSGRWSTAATPVCQALPPPLPPGAPLPEPAAGAAAWFSAASLNHAGGLGAGERSVARVRSEHPSWPAPQLEAEAKRQYEAAARAYYEQSLLTAHRVRHCPNMETLVAHVTLCMPGCSCVARRCGRVGSGAITAIPWATPKHRARCRTERRTMSWAGCSTPAPVGSRRSTSTVGPASSAPGAPRSLCFARAEPDSSPCGSAASVQRVVSESLRLRDALFPRQDCEPPPALLPFTNLHVSHGPMMQANVFCLLRVSCPVEVLKSAGVLAARVPRRWRLNSWSRRRLAPTASSSVRHPVFAPGLVVLLTTRSFVGYS